MTALTLQFRPLKLLLFFLCLVPLGLLVFDAMTGRLGVNPVESLLHRTGDWTLRLLLVTLAVTPLKLLTGKSQVIRYRRMLGLFTFFYAVLHITTYLWIDQAFLWSEIVADIVKRPYITVGFAAFMILLPLAVTSTRGMQRRLGRRWARLHKGVYPAALLGIVHFLWLVKADTLEPLIYMVIFGVLMLFRLERFRLKASSSPVRASR